MHLPDAQALLAGRVGTAARTQTAYADLTGRLDADLPRIRQWHRDAAARALDEFRRDHHADRLLSRLTRITDTTLKALWRCCQMPAHASLAAVGGYGRGELFPHSDVDLLILVVNPEAASGAIEALIGACWDCGLAIGHSVRTLDDCLRESDVDITVRTSLLEMRYLCGARGPLVTLGKTLAERLDPTAFASAKLLEMRQRHLRFEDTPYSLEPNTKESPGGLRDLQVLIWIARAAGLGRSWRELQQRGLITVTERRLLAQNERVLKQIRACLHATAGRREDRLVFDLQAQVARAVGLGGDDTRTASEALMQRYYWAAKAVSQLTSILLQNLQSRLSNQDGAHPQPLDDEFCMRGQLLEAKNPDLFEQHPAAMLRAFLHLCRRPDLHGMTATTLRQLWHARTRIDAGFRRNPEHRALFMEILRQPHGVTRALRRMNQWSVLGRYLPVFRRIVGRMQHDLFHVYTVDQHILMVVRNLRRFGMAEFAHEYPFCSQLMAGFDKPWLLVVAALFHDIAKGRGGDHSKLGRLDARRFCREHGLGKDERELIEFLVEHHLTMSTVAQKQDLSDPEVIAQFARLVRNPDRLVALYLLTVADIRGTSPKVWNAWKAKLLEELFRATTRHLAGDRPADAERLDLHRAEAVRLLNLRTIPPERYRDFWAGLGISYFLRTDPNDIAWHARVLASPGGQAEKPIVRCRTAAIGEGFQVAVYMRDQPDLFARICAYFDRKNLSVLDAQIHTSPDGRVLDSFLVIDPGGQSSYRDILQIIETELAQVLALGGALPAPVRSRISRRSRHFPVQPAVDLRPDERGRRYLLSVTANDRTGLLYTIAGVLSRHGLALHTARIMTLGERVEDVFVIDGAALSSPRGQLEFETELLAALQGA